MVRGLKWGGGEGVEMGGLGMGGLILYGACNGGPGIVRNVPNPAPFLHSTYDSQTWKPRTAHRLSQWTPTERISAFVSYHLNPLVQLLPSYVKNTTHLNSQHI